VIWRILALVLIPLSLEATTFQLVPTETQMREADGIIIGHYLKSKSVKLENGTIATQMVFKMEKEYGLRSDFFGMDEVIVHYPGGSMDGVTRKVEGVPQFIGGEKVALFTKNIDNRYWGLNLGFGSYKVISYGKDVILVNTLFPENAQIGQIKLQEFEQMIKTIKGSNLKVVQSAQFLDNPTAFANRAPASVPEGKNRSIASKNDEREDGSESRSLNVFWLIGFLAFCGGIFRMSRQKKI
jgi:hypothetical protein